MKKYMFTAKWCGYCQTMKPIVEQISGVEILDVDENEELAEKYSVMSLPAYLVISGDNIKIEYGLQPKSILEKFYE
jgi:thioredoxin 1